MLEEVKVLQFVVYEQVEVEVMYSQPGEVSVIQNRCDTKSSCTTN
jgi:hypothetical protein